MSASSRPTRRPRSRRPSARLSAVVDLPTPPLPEATAMTAATPGISACFDIGDGAPCGGRCAATGCTPGECACACRCGGGAADGVPGLRSAVSAIIAAVTPGIARTAASACARTLSQARASAASTLMEKNTLPSVTEITDSTLALVKGTPRGDATRLRESRTCCCVTLTRASPEALSVLIENRALLSCIDALSRHDLVHLGAHPRSRASFRNHYVSPMRPNRAVQRKRLPRSHVVPPLGRSCSRLLLGGLVVQLDHDAVGVIDEDLPEIAARHL